MTDLPAGVLLATFTNGYRTRSGTEFIVDSCNTKGHTTTTGELTAQGFEYSEAGGAYVKPPADDRTCSVNKNQLFK